MNIKRAKEEIEHTVRAYLAKDALGEYAIPAIRQRPILLMGPPGIGKTQVMEQVAREGFQNTSAPEPEKISSARASAGFSLVKTAVRFPLRAAAKPEATTAPPISLRSFPSQSMLWSRETGPMTNTSNFFIHDLSLTGKIKTLERRPIQSYL